MKVDRMFPVNTLPLNPLSWGTLVASALEYDDVLRYAKFLTSYDDEEGIEKLSMMLLIFLGDPSPEPEWSEPTWWDRLKDNRRFPEPPKAPNAAVVRAQLVLQRAVTQAMMKSSSTLPHTVADWHMALSQAAQQKCEMGALEVSEGG